jgi:phospholipase/carboxylesterase
MSEPRTAARELLDTVEVSTGPQPSFSVIWLHGLGADGHDFEPVVPHLGLGAAPAVRFVFPHAPVRPVTLNGGMPMRAWYDITAISASRDQDERGIEDSRRKVEALIDREAERGVPAHRVVLAGFSQGGAIALHAGLRHADRLAGIMALSSYLLFPDRLAAERSGANAGTPVFVGHGTLDPVVPFAMGQATAQALQSLSYPLTWRSYALPHSVSMEELADIGAWLRDRIG